MCIIAKETAKETVLITIQKLTFKKYYFKEASERFGDLAFLDSLVVTDQ